jgi:hypothetical protein
MTPHSSTSAFLPSTLLLMKGVIILFSSRKRNLKQEKFNCKERKLYSIPDEVPYFQLLESP